MRKKWKDQDGGDGGGGISLFGIVECKGGKEKEKDFGGEEGRIVRVAGWPRRWPYQNNKPLGILLLIELSSRFQYLHAFYSDEGWVPIVL